MATGRHCVTLILSIISMFLGLTKSHAQSYTVTELNYPNTWSIIPRAINNNGQIIGQMQLDGSGKFGNDFHAFLYKDGAIIDLGALPMLQSQIQANGVFVLHQESDALAINDNGQIIVRASQQRVTGSPYYLYSGNSVFTNVKDLPGWINGEPSAINNKGDITGSFTTSIKDSYQRLLFHAFLYRKNVFRDLGAFPNVSSSASAINNKAQVAGAMYADGAIHAFVENNGAIYDIGNVVGGTVSSSKAINDGGVVVGSANVKGRGNSRAFAYKAGKFSILQTLNKAHGDAEGEGDTYADGTNSEANAINNKNYVVGYTETFGTSLAVLWVNSKTYDLNSLVSPSRNLTLISAIGINDKGQIICSANNHHDNFIHTVLLTPIVRQISPVPKATSALPKIKKPESHSAKKQH